MKASQITKRRERLEIQHGNDLSTINQLIISTKERYLRELLANELDCQMATGHKWRNITDAQDKCGNIRRFRCEFCYAIK